jgi:hypothetical protein
MTPPLANAPERSLDEHDMSDDNDVAESAYIAFQAEGMRVIRNFQRRGIFNLRVKKRRNRAIWSVLSSTA